MEYVDRLLQETEYLQLIKELEEAEKDRIFCKHGLPHLLDVARIGWILALEGGVEAAKESEAFREKIYLTALLHDLGRLEETKYGIPHHKAGAVLAEELLARIQYPREERQSIEEAISGHRGEGKKGMETDLAVLIREADNRSRNCFCCSAQEWCSWREERKNQGIFR